TWQRRPHRRGHRPAPGARGVSRPGPQRASGWAAGSDAEGGRGMSGLFVLERLRAETRDREQHAFARRLSELRLAEELLRRASAGFESQRDRVADRAEARVSVVTSGAAAVVLHARHESRLRIELEALAFGRDVARRELAARSGRRDEAREALDRAEA